ncbi:thiamine-phosphate kinase [Woodsholea maritima]|uniref:thiamine-phosphate kinase n=1 Tax=Woodsholea maritima TaxID=240237 RepID=UPI00036DE94A|nr:thiamine-phosphate kinase [Woodsholea maritima]
MSDEGEFDYIARALAPLSADWPGAFALRDDAAQIPVKPGHTLVITSDMLVEDRHFLPSDSLEDIAWKALAVNVSDLVAKGAKPAGYLVSMAWTRARLKDRDAWAEGLKAAQTRFDLALMGGDTTLSDGPFTVSITALGWVKGAGMIRRAGAKAGDLIVVTGLIGDAGLGLQCALGELSLAQDHQSTLLKALRRPEPPLALVDDLPHYLRASADISDGLLSDLSHIATASGCGLSLDLERLPLSDAARAWLHSQANPGQALSYLASAGDDYQIIGAIRPEKWDEFQAYAQTRHHRVTQVGVFTPGPDKKVRYQGQDVALSQPGFTHF